MWPTVFSIPTPWGEMPIRSYGLMLMIGFLGGTWWAARRAARVKADPDLVINLGFVALLASVIGARAFYVIHYWEQFAGRGVRAVIDITAGGMEFYGGFIGAFVAILGYLLIYKASIRLYMDIIAPSLMFGMGMARIGCFLNGCCWGGLCDVNMPWGMTFPYASLAAHRQWEDRVVTFPAELIVVYANGAGATLVPRDELGATPEERVRPAYVYRKAQEALDAAKRNGADAQEMTALTAARDRAREAIKKSGVPFSWGQEEQFRITPSELDEFAHDHRSRRVHPAQIYSSMDGFILAILLSTVFYRRRRHGIVAGLFFLLYPLMRVVEETIRTDNPHDTAFLTISQFVSVVIFTIGVIYMVVLYRLPMRSPVLARAAASNKAPLQGARKKGSKHRP